MKCWEIPDIAVIALSETEHDYFGCYSDGSYIETIAGIPLCPILSEISEAIGTQGGQCRPPEPPTCGGGSEGGTVDAPSTDRLS